MIKTLRGRLSVLGPDWVIVDISGVGIQVFVPNPSSLSESGDLVLLHTHLVVREDELTLYGFPDEDSLRLFQLLLGVSGVGPRLALAVLTGLPARVLSHAIISENDRALHEVPGVGNRTAARIILELKGKLGGIAGPTEVATGSDRNDVVAALEGLGYSPSEARQATAKLPLDESLSLEEQIRRALQH
jgi:Holliday junction DNA helicase RuvA